MAPNLPLSIVLVALLAVCTCGGTTARYESTTTAADIITRSPDNPKLCKKAQCSHQCDVMEGQAVCSCPDDRMYLSSDGIHCKPRSCYSFDKSNKYECGEGAACTLQRDMKERKSLPSCYCTGNNWASFRSEKKYVLDPKNRSCYRNPIYETCDFPIKHSCSQICKTVDNHNSPGSHPVCSCRRGYTLDSDGKTCVVDNPCQINNKNGGCNQKCGYNKLTKKVACSCYDPSSHTLGSDGKTCVIRSCDNNNSGCSQGCFQADDANYFCTCDLGFQLAADGKTCNDVNECEGFHGCDQLCVPDDNHYFRCACRDGFQLAENGFSCRAGNQCTGKCSQHCDPTTGSCYCDKFHTLADDGVSCIDIDECELGTHDCQEICTNTKGGYSCSCRDPKARLLNDEKTCVVDTCSLLSAIQHGSVKCDRSHGDLDTMKVNDYCEFQCNPGFTLIGSRVVTCSEDGYDHEPPHCLDKDECENPVACPKDQVCSNTAGSFICFCKQGFRKVNGQCQDTLGPIISNCPADVTITIPSDSDRVTYSWTQPTAHDPTDSFTNCLSCPSTPSQEFEVGDHKIQYVFSDTSNNRASCSFKVKVVDDTAPVFSDCPDGETFHRSSGSYSLTSFANVTATDNSGYVDVTTTAPLFIDTPGVTTIHYLVKDKYSNQAECIFYVNITSSGCPELSPPTNGFHGCDDWNIGTFCTPRCNDGYSFRAESVGKYHCGDDGKWIPAEPIPDCFNIEEPLSASMTFVMTYLSPNCPLDDSKSLDSVSMFTRNTFSSNKNIFCFLGDCDLAKDPEVKCDSDKGNFKITITTNEDFTQATARNPVVLEFKRKVKAAGEKNPGFMSVLIPPLEIAGAVVDTNGLKATPDLHLDCPATTERVLNECVTCPGGMC